MIHRKFNKLKFKRTYIGGSKKRELEIFASVQGAKEDNSECDWFEYRRILMRYCDDILNVILSWKTVLNVMRHAFLILGILIAFMNSTYAIIAAIISFVAYMLYLSQTNKEMKTLAQYGFALDVINRETGVELSKN
jgi:hypothetical protein